MSVHLEIYTTDEQRNLQAFWRRVIYDVHHHTMGMKYLLHTKDRAKTWYFPSGGVEYGEHYDTMLEVYVVWVRSLEPTTYEHFGFSRLERTP